MAKAVCPLLGYFFTYTVTKLFIKRGESVTVKWEEPPIVGPGVWESRLLPLIDRPGEWAVVYETDKTATAHTIRNQLLAGRYGLPSGRWEFKARKTGAGGKIYARYLEPKRKCHGA